MLPLYSLGVMLSFTLSQFGMFRLMGRISHLKPGEFIHTLVTTVHYEKGTWWKRGVNGLGAIVTGIVFIILIATKFVEGAWIIVLAIPALVYLFRAINQHYAEIAMNLNTRDFAPEQMRDIADVVIMPVADIHKGTLRALRYARKISSNVQAVCIVTDARMKEKIETRWARFPEITSDIQLVMIDYEYRDILTPLVKYIEDATENAYCNQLVTVLIPEFISESWVTQLLHNQTAGLLRSRLKRHDNIVLIDVPYLVRHEVDQSID
jgi:hypothetical protein